MSLDRALSRHVWWIALFSLFINVTMLAAPLYMLQVYDRVLVSGSLETLIMLTLLCGGLLLGMALVTAARQWVLGQTARDLDAATRREIFERTVLEARGGTGDDRGAGDALRDLSTVGSFVTGPGAAALFDMPFAPLFFVVLYFVHPIFVTVALSGAVVILLLTLASEYAARAPMSRASEFGGRANRLAESFARDATSARVMGMRRVVADLWCGLHEESRAASAVAADRAAMLAALARFVRMGLQIAVLGVGAWLAIDNQISGGAMIAASILMGRALAPIEAAVGSWKSLVQSRQSYARLKALLHADTRRHDRLAVDLPSPRGLVSVRRVTHAHAPGRRPVLDGVTFDILAGEQVGIIGSSGSGKSTLARLLVGDEKPMQGTVTLDGADVANYTDAMRSRHFGYMPQDVNLMLGDISENISRFAMADPAADHDSISGAIVAAAQAAGAHGIIAELPEDYRTEVGEGGRLLSGGQRQRIALARALYGDVRLVVLDEPTSSLDEAGKSALRNALRQLRERRVTTVIITHDSGLLAELDRVYVMRAGRIARVGTPDEIAARRPHVVSSHAVAATSPPRFRPMSATASGAAPA